MSVASPVVHAVVPSLGTAVVSSPQSMQIDYGAGLAPSARSATAVFDASTTYNVVTIRNQTANPIHYSLQWAGGARKDFTVNAHSNMIHWTIGSNISATIGYDSSFAPGYQGRSFSLTSRDFVGGGFADIKPSHNADGMQYYFTRNSTNTGLNFYADVVLDKTALAQYRAGVNAGGDFPQLLSNFQVLAAPTKTYNCIAYTLGYKDRWINPITSSGPNKLAGMDHRYAQEGYHRLSTLDFSLQRGYQKVVVYATVSNGVIQNVTHGAIQQTDGSWNSKLGANALIKNLSPYDLAGGLYGVPVAVYIRRIS
jgi:hypothetical protein